MGVCILDCVVLPDLSFTPAEFCLSACLPAFLLCLFQRRGWNSVKELESRIVSVLKTGA